MLDAEYVLRFLTLSAEWKTFSGDLSRSMDDFMERFQAADKRTLRRFRGSFDRAIDACRRLWSFHAFNRPDRDGWRDQTLAGMYDAEMVAVSLLTDDELENLDPRAVLRATRRLFTDPQFDTSVRVGTNTPRRVRYRIQRMADALRDLS